MPSTLQKNTSFILTGMLCTIMLVLATSAFAQTEEADSAEVSPTNTTATQERGPRIPPSSNIKSVDARNEATTAQEQNRIERQTAMSERASTTEARVAERSQTKAERSETIKLKQEEMQAVSSERKATLHATAQTRIINLAANLSNRMDAAVGRIQNVIDRLSSRIVKLNELGVDTTTASRSLDKAQQEIDNARTILSTIDTKVAEFIGSEDPRASWKNLRTIYSEARDAIKASHEALRATVASLKEAIRAADIGRGVSGAVSNDDHSTTTP